jgi:hypothetical protein
MKSPESGVSMAISTGCFLRSNGRTAIRNGLGRILWCLYAPELEEAVHAAELLDTNIEVVYRPGMLRQVTSETPSRITQVHAPIMYDLISLMAHPYNLNPNRLQMIKDYVVNYVAMITTMGDVSSNFEEAAKWARSLDANIVMHPDGVRKLAKHKPDLLQQFRDLINEEADWAPIYAKHLDAPLVCRDALVAEDIRKFGIGANPDTSHFLIANNPAPHDIYDSLCRMLEIYGDTVRGAHISAVATNPDDIESVYNGGGSLPFNSERINNREYTDSIRRFVADLHEYAKKHERVIPVSIEAYGWAANENTYEARLRGVEATLNGLKTKTVPHRRISRRNSPTRPQ